MVEVVQETSEVVEEDAQTADAVTGDAVSDKEVIYDADKAEGSQKTDSAASQEEKDGDADDSQDAGAPDNYGDFSLPDGVEANQELMTEFQAVAKELNLSQEKAQKLVDLQAKEMQRFAASQQENWNRTQESWKESAKADSEYGGQEFEANIGLAHKALETYGTDGLREILDATGAGNHPEVIRFFVKIGKDISEDNIVRGDSKKAKPTAAEVLYGNN